MNVYLLPINESAPIVFSEGPTADHGDVLGSSERPRRGILRRLSTSFRTMKRSMERSEGGLGPRVIGVWRWLQRQIGADEPLLRSLRRSGRIEVHHPASIPGARARVAWEHYLSGRFTNHMIWLVVNGLLSPFSILLTPVPGPNMIGYWFVYRTACHALALLGLRRARGGRVETTFHPSEDLDTLMADPDKNASGHGARALADFVRRRRSDRPMWHEQAAARP